MPCKKRGRAGWRRNGTRVYHVTGKRKSTRKTYSSKHTALKGIRKKRKR